jgi:predicted nucleotidyltransferase
MNAIVWSERTATDVPPPGFWDRLSKRLEDRVEKAYVFGSHATGDFRPGSDVDLILVVQTDLPFVERPRLFHDLFELFPRLDVLVYRPDELAAQLERPAGFWKSVSESMREIPTRSRGRS